ncbi:hypothetical protein Kpol_541p13 [Vanderwaltozyma polyspora DSM 70294]|uniref:CTD kinase subunit gamma Ctk3 C-terminal domain-containing protein n=1 Tax=Vanderwaltozyma polyspora (strain ATCC 22028 / DSM 70294 / BCRC 21397 / CBS 2163 / NBRC 10782 / NRRL Y-8283 / UCD 57-17) TaxID=436907 RepID=A7TIV8_VANPO|nr:uncharacterized protein Kpol_541p13 [Vanderwaltozyma polyspora DSM 70294]EDO17770.1 hypothetical protein Kpol_541p13 [Vanderwaltozyma polyspora DSM 70294]
MDSFEARLQFIQVLKNLQKTLNITRETSPTPSLNTSSKSNLTDPVQFYLKGYEQHYEDFHQCMFTSGEKMDPLDRLNIVMYYQMILIALWPISQKEGNNEISKKVIFKNLLPSIDKIFQLALPPNEWKSLVNLPKCIDIFKSLNKICGGIIDENQIQELDKEKLPLSNSELIEDETKWLNIPMDNLNNTSNIDYKESFQNCFKLLIDRKCRQQLFFQNYENPDKLKLIFQLPQTTSTQITLHRMESDRERHKRAKEHMWFINKTNMLDESEFQNLWNKIPNSLTAEDLTSIQEIQSIAKQSYMI